MGRKVFGNVLLLLVVAGCIAMTLYVGNGTEMLIYNFAFFGVMILIYAVALIGGFFKMSSLTHDFMRASRKAEENSTQLKDGQVFENKEMDGQLQSFYRYVEDSESGIGDVEDYINEEVVDSSIHKRLLDMAPDVFTSLGILGTFVGLVWGLKNFEPTNYEAMTNSVSALVEGIKVAFLTSIYGLALSLVYSFNLKASYNELMHYLEEFLENFHKHVIPSREAEAQNVLVACQKEQTDAVRKMAEQFSSQLADSFEQVITPTFKKMNQSLDYLVTTISKGQSEMLREILDEFMKNMNNSFHMEFQGFNKAIEEMTKAQQSNTAYTKQLYQQLSTELSASFQQDERNMRSQILEIASLQNQYMIAAEQVLNESQKMMQEQKDAYKHIMDYMKEAEQTSAKFWVACNQTMQKYLNAAAAGLEGFSVSQKYNEQLYQVNEKMVESYTRSMEEYVASQKQVSEALEQIKRMFEDLAISRDDKNIYLHRGNLQNVSANRELVQQMETMLREEKERQEETMQEMSEWIQELAKNGGKANSKFGLFKSNNGKRNDR
ncbi:MAG TPA: MotA/TolQ/ExbB proton channel family protein [Candidatus Limivivens merdigallinarum]|uniref:MotA/TolQ/ExbB proton channel family protein n=1 Tax=Candidatus Limivivens merdigallinarum TaxID=2840859 RepID=A0A9D0ZU68_9FIRM|nr:MotA/TolQ/ExbB proton channel family protein [Candidatus Limivivens merdigallinarum]